MPPTDPTDPHAGSAIDASQSADPVREDPQPVDGPRSGTDESGADAAARPGSGAGVFSAPAGGVPRAASGSEAPRDTARASGWPEIASPEQLGEARERRDWSVADAASKLGMVPRQIEALERGEWSALPGLAFVRGGIRAYGKALQVDVGPLLASIGGAVGSAELRPAASLEAPLPRRGALGFDNGGSGSRLTWILLGVLGVVAIALYFGRGPEWAGILPDSDRAPVGAQSGAETPASPATDSRARTGDGAAVALPEPLHQAPTPSVSQAPVAPAASASAQSASASTTTAPASPAAAAPAQSSAAASPSAGSGAARTPGAPGDAAQAPESAAAGGAGSAASAGAAAPADPAVLRFRFEEESWVEVRDATGKLMLYGLQAADSTRDVSGQRPYRLVIGNATHVRLQHDGRDIDLGAISRQGVARLRID